MTIVNLYQKYTNSYFVTLIKINIINHLQYKIHSSLE